MPSHVELPPYTSPLAGGTLHYTQAGNATPAILLIHGSLCDYRYWRWQIPALSERYRVFAPSLRGCWPDQSPHPQPGYRLAQHAQDLADWLQRLDLPQGIHLVGHSRGAQVALMLARVCPDTLCRSLTLADPAFRFTDEAQTPPFYAAAVQHLEAGQIDAAMETFIDLVNGPDTWRKMVSWFKDMVRDNATTLRSQILESDIGVSPADAAQLSVPLSLITGANSPAKYGSRLERLSQLLPQAQRTRIALAAHGMNLANPRAFNRAVLEFCQAVDKKAETA